MERLSDFPKTKRQVNSRGGVRTQESPCWPLNEVNDRRKFRNECEGSGYRCRSARQIPFLPNQVKLQVFVPMSWWETRTQPSQGFLSFWGYVVVVRFPAVPCFWDVPSAWGGLQRNTTAYTYMIPVHLGNSNCTFQEE